MERYTDETNEAVQTPAGTDAEEAEVPAECAENRCAEGEAEANMQTEFSDKQAQKVHAAELQRLKSENEIKQMIYQSGARNPAFLETVIREQVLKKDRYGSLAKEAVAETIETLRRTNGYLFADVSSGNAAEAPVLRSDLHGSAVLSGYATGVPFAGFSSADPALLSDADYYRMVFDKKKRKER